MKELELIGWLLFIAIESFIHLYIYYIAVMEAAKKWGRDNKLVRLFAYVFIVFDALVNIFVVTFMFLELPREGLVTSRLKRWRRMYEFQKFTSLSWIEKNRLLFAIWLCDQHLDYHDLKGEHC